jgi:hypothetical protein
MLLASAFASNPSEMSNANLLKAWCAVVYLHPEIHPDDFDESNNDWPEDVKIIAGEVWRRYDKNEVDDEDVYQSDVAWAGVYDLMSSHTAEETKRRNELAARYSHA